MKMYSVVRYLSSETKVSAKGNPYKIILLMQEGAGDVLSCIDETNLNFNFGDEIQAVFEYSPRYKSLSFVGIQEAF